jgi:hypothetical protein
LEPGKTTTPNFMLQIYEKALGKKALGNWHWALGGFGNWLLGQYVVVQREDKRGGTPVQDGR